MPKSAQAFRTIREVADWLDVAAHVLRFWESKFNQIKPVKRAGGRRYYRPADMELVGGIKVLLHDRGLTIRGVQMMIADEGLEAVTSLSPPIDELIGDADTIDLEPTDPWAEDTAAETETLEPEASAPPEPEVAEPPQPEEAIADIDTDTPEDLPIDVPQEDPVPEPVPDTVPESAPADPEPVAEIPTAAAIPASDPAEGRLGTLAAMGALPAQQRAILRLQIAALAKLRDRMSAPADAG